MNEEQKPHKTWTMYKKVYTFEDFNVGDSSTLIPIFTSTNIATDKYGEWNIIENSQDGKEMYKAFNNNISDCGVAQDKTVPKFKPTLEPCELILPSGIAIKPTKFIINCAVNTALRTALYGYNTNTKQYEKLASVQTTYVAARNYTFNIQTNNYYNKFKLVCEHMTDGFSDAAFAKYYDIRLISGTIRKG